MFADTKRPITMDDDVTELQHDIDTTHCWTWGMKLNTDKCKELSIRKAHTIQQQHSPSYTMNNKILCTTDNMFDSGVTVDTKLTWQHT